MGCTKMWRGYIHISPTRQVSNRHVILDSAVIAHMVVLSK